MKNFYIILFLIFPFGLQAQNWDINTLKKINAQRNANTDPIMIGISNSIYPITIATPLTEMAIGYWKQDEKIFTNGVSTFGAIGLNYLTTKILKSSIDRNRPFVSYPGQLNNYFSPTDGSLPSGHTSGAFAIATSLSIHYPKWYVIAPAYLWSSAVAYSRMYLGVHYPSDIFLGTAIGIGSAYASHYLNRWIKGKYNYTQKLRIIKP